MQKILNITIDGKKIVDIASFYLIINELLMVDEDWHIGNSLDALDDLFYGGYGRLKNYDLLEIHWYDHAISSHHLGYQATYAYYQQKLKSPARYNKKMIQKRLEELKNGNGQTYFDIIVEIIQSHPNIRLILS